MKKTDELVQLANEIKQECEINRKNAILQGYHEATEEVAIYFLMEYPDDKETLKMMRKLVRHMKKEKERIKQDMGL